MNGLRAEPEKCGHGPELRLLLCGYVRDAAETRRGDLRDSVKPAIGDFH